MYKLSKTPSLWAVFFVFYFSIICRVSAQMQAPNYTVIGRNEGIPEMTINGLVEDIDGFVWFANGSALCRWDGQHFQQHWLMDKDGIKLRDYKWVASWDSTYILVLVTDITQGKN